MALGIYLQFGDNNISRYSSQYMLKDMRVHVVRAAGNIRPTADAFCEAIEVSMFAPGKDDPGIYDWFIDGGPRSGRLLIEENDPGKDSGSVWQQILFDDALCYSLREEYLIDDSRRVLKLGFMAAKVQTESITFQR